MTTTHSLIRPLPESVVNRIAAGEIIHRPSNALKELLENAFDANASSIQISIKDGGLAKLAIIDNGDGIHCEDLPILCQRFTTSKLKEFEDLSKLCSYGFRGEALASISHVSHLTVATKRSDSLCAFKASYIDGKIATGCPKPCAGNQGTHIIVEDLFYNCPTRKTAMKSYSEEYSKILDMVSLYAIHRSGIGISCKKEDSSHFDLQTSVDATVFENIQAVFGVQLSKELLRIEGSHMTSHYFDFDGYVTHSGYHKRLVECKSLKQAILSLYSSLLPKKAHPFIYLSIHIKPDQIDVNVHPTKQEVYILNEEDLIKIIIASIQKRLCNVSSKMLDVSTSLVTTPVCDASSLNSSPKEPVDIVPIHSLIRTDAKSQSLLSFTTFQRSSRNEQRETHPEPPPLKKVKVEIRLKSILELREGILQNHDYILVELFKNHTYIGFIDEKKALIQYCTSLYMIDYSDLCYHVFYEWFLREFSNVQCQKLRDPISLPDEHPENNTDAHSNHLKSKEISFSSTVLKFKDMLYDYFGILLSSDGRDILGLPLVLNSFPLRHCSSLLVHELMSRLIYHVNWTDEKECLNEIIIELASFFSKMTMNHEVWVEDDRNHWLEFTFFPSLKANCHFPKQIRDNITHLTDLKDLYKVFERC